MRRQGRDLNKIYWECIYNRSTKCRGRLKSIGDELHVTNGKCQIHGFLCLNPVPQSDLVFFLFFFSFYECYDFIQLLAVEHNHVEDFVRVEAAQQAGCLVYRTISSIGGSKVGKFAFDCTMIEYDAKDGTEVV